MDLFNWRAATKMDEFKMGARGRNFILKKLHEEAD
jgi:hypothetical protein